MLDLTQSGIVAEVKRGAWKACIIDRNAPGRNHGVADSCRYMVRLDHPNGFNTSWPVKYDNGTIAYDIFNAPRDAQRATKAAYKLIDRMIAKV